MSEIFYQSATSLAHVIKTKKLSVLEVMDAHIDRIEKYNSAINAIVTADLEAARQHAKDADKLLAADNPIGPLFGLPVVHKDNVSTKGMRTTFGSLAYENNIPNQDSLIVKRQRDAGAITLGKSNMPEFGAGSHTFNEIFGATKNPYHLGVSAGGSSGGAAAALAAGFVPLADGSDMGGSLRNPASFCNVVGLRPSLGRVPIVPSSFPFGTLGVAGPMARTVEDVALYLSVIAGPDPRDPYSAAADSQVGSVLSNIETKGIKLAFSADIGGLPFDPQVSNVIAQSLPIFESMGCHVEQAEPDFSEADFAFEVLRGIAFATNFGPLRAAKGDLLKNTVVWNIDVGLNLRGEEIARAERIRSAMFLKMEQFLLKYDFLICPTVQVLPFDINMEYPLEINGTKMGTYIEWMRSACRITITGHPAISIPCGFSDGGLPIGIQIVGPYRREKRLLEFAKQFELANPVGLIRPAL
ncbi:amidase [Polynucleobacter necessarius]|uniref:amidase n=1 Tax=Polynucleobacter necessarius TaxID=576610 RepID=UPI000E09B3FB|nr:amidase [Polynucleobacter necessarius]